MHGPTAIETGENPARRKGLPENLLAKPRNFHQVKRRVALTRLWNSANFDTTNCSAPADPDFFSIRSRPAFT
jgi:hypothetical protein